MSVLGMLTVQEAHAITAALRAARNVGLLDALADQPRSARAAATACKLDPRATGVLLRALAALELIEEHDGTYSVAAPSVDRSVELWDGLEARLRHGVLPIACDTSDAAVLYRDAARTMAAFAEQAAEQVAEILAAPDLDVVELGAGAVPWSLAMLRRAPASVTAVDYPEVLTTTRQVVAEAGMGDAYTYVGGDLFSVDLPREAYDLAIFGNLCHLYGDADNRRMIAQARGLLRKGGTIAIIDQVPPANGGPPDARTTAAYDLSLLLRTSEGRVHPFSSYASWLREAGFEELRRTSLGGPFPPTLIHARRPSPLEP